MGLIEEMDEVLMHGVEKLTNILRTNLDTKAAFGSMAGVIGEVAKYVEEQNRGQAGSLFREHPRLVLFFGNVTVRRRWNHDEL